MDELERDLFKKAFSTRKGLSASGPYRIPACFIGVSIILYIFYTNKLVTEKFRT